MTPAKPRLVMLARVPEFGCVKSRLAQHVGKAQALRAHVHLLQANLAVAAACQLPLELHYDGDAGQPLFGRLARCAGAELIAQVDGDIGDRMLAAAQARHAPSIVIGSDCGALTTDYLHHAARALHAGVVVLGSAEDGGYVLIGQQTPTPELFAEIDWGTDQVAQQTRSRAVQLGLTVVELPVQWDVDAVEDWRRYRQGR